MLWGPDSDRREQYANTLRKAHIPQKTESSAKNDVKRGKSKPERPHTAQPQNGKVGQCVGARKEFNCVTQYTQFRLESFGKNSVYRRVKNNGHFRAESSKIKSILTSKELLHSTCTCVR